MEVSQLAKQYMPLTNSQVNPPKNINNDLITYNPGIFKTLELLIKKVLFRESCLKVD